MSLPAPSDAHGRSLGPGLLIVLVAAKLTMVAGVVPLDAPWTFLALCWQDVATAVVAAFALRLVPRPWIAATIYAAFVGYIALNVPAARVLGSTLTPTMWHAARGALGDSVRYHLTPANLALLAAFLVLGAAAPAFPTRWLQPRAVLLAALGIVTFGPMATQSVDTLGFDRNALTALLPRVWARRAPNAGNAVGHDRTSFESDPEGTAPDLNGYRGRARGMNVILIVLESTAAQYLAPYAAADDPMPTLTRISQHALVADRAYAAYPESVKGLYATLCGRHPRFGLGSEAHATLPCPSIALSLRHAGYRTALFHSGRFNYLGMDALLREKGFEVTADAGAIGGQVESSFGVEEAATIAHLLGWIDQRPDGAPFFAAYLPAAGHHPYASPTRGPFPVTSEIGRYKNALHDADTALRALLAGLHARGLENHTALVIVGDHGEAFNQHPGNSGHTLFIYEENVRVPFVVSVPGGASRRTSSVASLVDVPSTIRDLVGIEAEDDDGISLLSPVPRMAFFFTDYALGWIGLRDGCRKYIEEVGTRRSKLFDVCMDPQETEDLGPSAPEVIAAYQRRVESLLPD